MQVITMTLANLPLVIIYMYDFFIHSETVEEHLDHIKTIKRLKKHKIKLNFDKYEWFTIKVKLLGHIIISEGIKMDP